MNVINFRLDKIRLLTMEQELFCCLSELGHRQSGESLFELQHEF
jgi:hypothetical protein